MKFADYRGDSLRLNSRCHSAGGGIHRFLRRAFHGRDRGHPDGRAQVIILPDLNAGCSMADMANLGQVEVCWEKLEAVKVAKSPRHLHQFHRGHQGFLGEERRRGVHLFERRKIMRGPSRRRTGAVPPRRAPGRNTGFRLGIPLEKMAVWIRRKRTAGSRTTRFATRAFTCGRATAPCISVSVRSTWSASAKASTGHPGHRAPRVLVGGLRVGR